MCRLYCEMSSKAVSPYRRLFRSEYSIAKQAKKEANCDGWGVGYYDNGRLTSLTRKTTPLHNDLAEAKAITKSISSNISFFFIRKASNPLKHEKKALLTLDATQPFSHDNVMFMHNGVVNAPDKVMSVLRGYGMSPRSLNDSEVYFIAFLKYLDEKNDVYAALKAAERLINETFGDGRQNGKTSFESLNVIISDGVKVYAYNRYNSNYRMALINKDRENYKMCFRADGNSIVIASEPLDRKDGWQDIGNGKFLEAGISDGNIWYRVRE